MYFTLTKQNIKRFDVWGTKNCLEKGDTCVFNFFALIL